MKTIPNLLLGLLAIIAITSCDDEELSHTQVTPVKNLYSPDDNAFFNLGASSSAVFEWEPALAEDNGVVLYEVLFDMEGGDFSNPLYIVTSDGKGLQRTLDLPFSDLNKVAEMAGIQPEESGKLSWTVVSSKGINVQPSMTSRTIEVERPAGFPPPDELFMAGSATEAGDDISNGMLMKKIGTSSFEIYTSLKPGEYYFATRNNGEGDTYFIENDKLKAEGQTTVTDEEKVYRIRVNFNDATTKIDEIEKVGLWFPPVGEFLFDLPYNGKGTWEIDDTPIEFKQESWGRDERYKFRFVVKQADGSEVDEWFGSTNGDNQRPDENTPASFWYMVTVTDDYWSNSFKFEGEVDMNTSDIEIIFNTSVPAYTHVITPH